MDYKLFEPSLPISQSLGWSSFSTIILWYLRQEKQLPVSWFMTALPIYIYLLIHCIKGIKNLLLEEQSALPQKDILHVTNHKYILAKESFKIIVAVQGLILTFFVSDYLDQLEQEDKLLANKDQIYIWSIILTVTYLVYCWYLNSIKTEILTGSNISCFQCLTNFFMIFISGVSSLSNILISFLSSSFFVCSGGACNSIAVSTLSSFFGAIGVSVVDWLPFLDFLTLGMIGFSLISLYARKKSYKYKPFISGCVGSCFILLDILIIQTKYVLYLGNFILIVAAIWNSRTKTSLIL